MATTEYVQITTRGFQQFRDKLGELKSETQRSIAFSATGAAAKVVRVQAQANAESAFTKGYSEGVTKKNIAVVRKKTSGDVYRYEVGVRHGTVKQKKSGDDPFYWWFHEFGYTSRGGKQIGPTPFLTPAFESTKSAQLDAMAKRLQSRLKKYGLGERGKK